MSGLMAGSGMIAIVFMAMLTLPARASQPSSGDPTEFGEVVRVTVAAGERKAVVVRL